MKRDFVTGVISAGSVISGNDATVETSVVLEVISIILICLKAASLPPLPSRSMVRN
jgi:hypothetical protein